MQGGNILSIYSNTSVILRKEEQEKHSLPPTTYNEYPYNLQGGDKNKAKSS